VELLAALSDGVSALAMTPLVFDLREFHIYWSVAFNVLVQFNYAIAERLWHRP
jgi:hypothetical protein